MVQHTKKSFSIIIASVAALGVVAAAAASNAQSKITFQQDSTAHITAVDAVAHTITVSYMQPPATSCATLPGTVPPMSPVNNCPPSTGRPPDVLREGEVLATDVNDQVENDFTQMSVGDSVIVYFKDDGSAPRPFGYSSIPYAMKDVSHTIGCPPGICGSSKKAPPQAVNNYQTAATAPPQAVISTNLSAGAQGQQVLLLQQELQAMGYFPFSIAPTGYFGPTTKKAVMNYQAAKGLPATGLVNSATRQALFEQQAPSASVRMP